MNRTQFTQTTALLLGALTFGCTPSTAGDAIRPAAPSAGEAMQDADTSVPCDPAAELSALTADLPSSTRISLETSMKRGVAIIAHDCKRLRVLESCRLSGDYEFAGVSRKEDLISLESTSELGANLPFGAAQFAGALAQGSSIQLALVQVGTQRALFDQVGRPELEGSCDGATHFVRGTSVGAFAMLTSASGEAKVVAEVFGMGASAKSASRRSTDLKDGNLSRCRESKPDAESPPAECGVPVRLNLIPLLDRVPERKSKAAAEPPPEGLRDGCPKNFRRVAGKCSKQAAGAYLCEQGDEPGCRAQCDAGDPGSCYNLGVLLQQRHHDSVSKSPPTSAEARLTGMELVKYIEQKNAAITATYRPLYVQACKGGIALACDRLYWLKGDDVERRQALTRACDLGNGPSCRMDASQYLYDAATRDLAKARSRLERGCRLGARASCVGLVDTYFSPPGGAKPTKAEQAEGERTLQRLCLANDAGACWQLADRRGSGDGLTQDVGLANAYLDRACSLGDLTACFELGQRYLAGDPIGKNPALATRYFEQSCPLEKPTQLTACVAIGRLFREGKAIAKDPAQALGWLGRGCRYGEISSCLALADMYASGEGTAANPTRALELYEQACADGAPDACVARVSLLKTRDRPLALELARTGCKAGMLQHCQLALDIAGAKAVEIFDADCSDQSPMACLELGKLLDRKDPKRAYAIMHKLCPDGSGLSAACDAVKRLSRFAPK